VVDGQISDFKAYEPRVTATATATATAAAQPDSARA
jgi:hypothetical protein